MAQANPLLVLSTLALLGALGVAPGTSLLAASPATSLSANEAADYPQAPAAVEQSPGMPGSAPAELPGSEGALAMTPYPIVGCWFWGDRHFEPEGYKPFLDASWWRTPLGLLTASIRAPVEVTDPKVHDQIREAVLYGREHGLAIAMDLDVRLARQAFMDRHPDQMQELLRLRETPLEGPGDVSFEIKSTALGDHYTYRATGYVPLSGRLVPVLSLTVAAMG